MSRRDGIEKLLQGGAKVAPTVNDMKRAQSEPEPEKPPAETPPPPQPARPKRRRATKQPDPMPVEPMATGAASIRFQVTAPDGSEIEKVLQDVLSKVPEPLRSGINVGSFFRQVMIENDAEIAAMIATVMEGNADG